MTVVQRQNLSTDYRMICKTVPVCACMCDLICMLGLTPTKCNLLLFKCLDLKAAKAQIKRTPYLKSCFFDMDL